MFLIAYDIRNDKLRTRFSKFIKQFGRRLQYSVYEITNSPRILSNIRVEIEKKFERQFEQSDSVLIFDVPDNACVGRFGYPVNEEGDLILSG